MIADPVRAEVLAVIVAMVDGEPKVLTVPDRLRLPPAPYFPSTAPCKLHRPRVGRAADWPLGGLSRTALHLR